VAAATAVLIAAAAFAGGSLTTAVAGAPKALSANQVKKIADKEIKKKAKTLSVAHAGTSDFATSAGSAATATKVGSSSVSTFSAQLAPNAAPVTLATFGPMTLQGSCPAGVTTLTALASPNGGAIRFTWINNAGTTGHSGAASLSTLTVNDTTTTSGSGQLEYAPTTTGPAASMSFSWRTDNGACQFLGSSVSG
jgi:hypothetical protein